MAQIKVNCRELTNASNTIDRYVSKVNRHMNEIDSTVDGLSAEWQGGDYNQFKNEWNEINAPGSTTDDMKRALKNYGDALRASAKLYQEAQSRAINRANALCK